MKTTLARLLAGIVLATTAFFVTPAAPAQAALTVCTTPVSINGVLMPAKKYLCGQDTATGRWFDYTTKYYDFRLHVFLVGTDRQVWHIWQVSQGGPATTAWVSLGGQATSTVDAHTGATGATKWIWINVFGTDNRLYCKTYNRPTHQGRWWPSQTTWALVPTGTQAYC